MERNLSSPTQKRSGPSRHLWGSLIPHILAHGSPFVWGSADGCASSHLLRSVVILTDQGCSSFGFLDFRDYDNDGLSDLIVTDIATNPSCLTILSTRLSGWGRRVLCFQQRRLEGHPFSERARGRHMRCWVGAKEGAATTSTESKFLERWANGFWGLYQIQLATAGWWFAW